MPKINRMKVHLKHTPTLKQWQKTVWGNKKLLPPLVRTQPINKVTKGPRPCLVKQLN